MKNIGNDPRSLFNGNHFSSWRASEASETLSGLFNRESDICIYYSTYVCHICPMTISDSYNP